MRMPMANSAAPIPKPYGRALSKHVIMPKAKHTTSIKPFLPQRSDRYPPKRLAQSPAEYVTAKKEAATSLLAPKTSIRNSEMNEVMEENIAAAELLKIKSGIN